MCVFYSEFTICSMRVVQGQIKYLHPSSLQELKSKLIIITANGSTIISDLQDSSYVLHIHSKFFVYRSALEKLQCHINIAMNN